MSGIDFTQESPIKMLALLRMKQHRKLHGQDLPKSMNGFWHIAERTDISKRGGFAKVVRVMTSDPINEPVGEEFTLPYGMVCSAMEQLSITPIG